MLRIAVIDQLHSNAQMPTGNETNTVIALHDLNSRMDGAWSSAGWTKLNIDRRYRPALPLARLVRQFTHTICLPKDQMLGLHGAAFNCCRSCTR